MLEVLYRLNPSYTRPTYTLKKANSEKQEAFKQDFDVLKNLINGKIDNIPFEDGSMIRDYRAISETCFPKGEQRTIPTYVKHSGVKLLGILNYETGKIYCVEQDKYDTKAFLGFIKNILKEYPEGKLAMILDN